MLGRFIHRREGQTLVVVAIFMVALLAVLALAIDVGHIYSERRRSAALAVGSDDDCIVWVNRRPVLRGSNHSSTTPGEFIEPIALSPGWSEVLVRVNNLSGPWGFCLELLDPLAREPLPGVRFSSTPPHTEPPAR